ncbi:hypothetical protein SUGI_0750570 [Cryptomeria japonica]|nr:hypothetical protein SUGI_0750570 [Cryptomeria japonica]
MSSALRPSAIAAAATAALRTSAGDVVQSPTPGAASPGDVHGMPATAAAAMSSALRLSATAATTVAALRTSVGSPGAASPGVVHVSSARVSDGDMVLPAPSPTDRGIRGLGPVAVSGFLAKPSSAAHLDLPKLGTNHKRFS